MQVEKHQLKKSLKPQPALASYFLRKERYEKRVDAKKMLNKLILKY